MKLISFLAGATAVTSAAFLFGLVFDLHALALFGVATICSLLLVAVRDYLPVDAGLIRLTSRSSPMVGRPSRARPKYKWPFAA